MDVQLIVSLVKASLGFNTNIRDTYLTAIAESVVKELIDEKGLSLESDNPCHLMFCVDYTVFRYKKPSDGMPRDLQFRLHNLMVHNGGGSK